jgi:mRNA interferase MazF
MGMAITFHPKQGTVLICDYSGFVLPEMIKRRPVVIVSPTSRKQQQLYTIVPLSTTKPVPIEAHHHKMNPLSLPGEYAEEETWAKCDMIATVSIARFDRIKLGKDVNGKRQYVTHHVIKEDLDAIIKGLLKALGLATLTQHL